MLIMPTLLLKAEGCLLTPATQGIQLLLLPLSSTIQWQQFPLLSSGLQRRALVKLFKDAGAPLVNLFLTFVVKSVSCQSS